MAYTFVVGNFVTGTQSNENPKTGKALSCVESINGDGTLNLRVIASIYTPDDNRGIHVNGCFNYKEPDLYRPITIYKYVEEYGLDHIYFMEWFEEYGKKEKYSEIKEGTLVICNERGRYAYTNERTLCYVNRVFSYGTIEVTTVTNYNGTYSVDKKNFDTISVEEYFGRFPNAPIMNAYKDYVLGGYYRSGEITPNTDGGDTVNGNNGIMDLKHREYPVSNEITEEHTDAMMRAYGMFKYGVMHDAVKQEVEEVNKAKAGIRNVLSNDPNWDSENMWIRHSTDWKRPIVMQRVEDFADWFNQEMRKIYSEKSHVESGMNGMEVEDALRKVSNTVSLMIRLLKNEGNMIIDKDRYGSVSLNGFTLDYYMGEKQRLQKIKDAFYGDSFYYNGKYTYLSLEDGNLYTAVAYILCNLYDWIEHDGHTITTERARQINEAFANCHKPNGRKLIRVNKDMKYSRFMALLGKLTGVDKIVKMETRSWYADGVYHEREEDTGWNSRFAKFADGINPYVIKRHTIISTNPVDYLLASNGTNWVSCHHLCREDMNKSGSYNAMYSGGASGYMLDNSTVVMYMIDETYDGDEFMFVPKERRCLFHIGEDKLIQGRVYPDGRDGGELGASEQMRIIMQTILADCLGVPNLWKVETGTSAIYPHEITNGENYEDYENYDDCTISFLKGNNSDYVIRPAHITIGARAMCPVCGERHNRRGWLYCSSHSEHYNKRDDDNASYMVKVIEGSEENRTCSACGHLVHRDDVIHDVCTGKDYCCVECAESDGCHYCFNTSDYRSNHVYYDNYHGAYFYDRYDSRIITTDGHTYINNFTAGEAGYVFCEDIRRWVIKEEARYCFTCDRWVTKENYEEKEEKCKDCVKGA